MHWLSSNSTVLVPVIVAVLAGIGFLMKRYAFPEKSKTASASALKSHANTVFKDSPISSSAVAVGENITIGPVAGRDINIETYIQDASFGSEARDEDYRERPTPIEISESIRKVSLFLQESVADAYRGLKVHWRTRLYNVHPLFDDIVDVSLKFEGDGPFVVTKVNLSEYPILKTVRGEEPVEVTGTIEYVQRNGMVHLKDVRLKFGGSDT